MNKITRKPRGIQYKWVEVKGWDFIREPIKMKKYFKQATALNKRYKARCFKWYDEFENEYTYALWVFELTNNEYKERVHAGHCGRFTKGHLKRYLRNLPKELELLQKLAEERKKKRNEETTRICDL